MCSCGTPPASRRRWCSEPHSAPTAQSAICAQAPRKQLPCVCPIGRGAAEQGGQAADCAHFGCELWRPRGSGDGGGRAQRHEQRCARRAEVRYRRGHVHACARDACMLHAYVCVRAFVCILSCACARASRRYYGVEAARATIVSEIKSVFGVYGIQVSTRPSPKPQPGS